MEISRLFKWVPVLAAACFAISCIGDDTVLCRDTVMGNFKDGALLTDGGLVYNIVETNVVIDVKDTVRVLAVCDVLKQTGTSETEYDVRLLSYSVPLTKDALTASAITDWESVGSDPVCLQTGWFSGGYLNMLVQYSYDSSSETVHNLDLVFDDARSNTDTLRFELRHNAHGECYCEGNQDNENLAIGSAYSCFPIVSFLPSGKKSVVVGVDWTWHETGAGYLQLSTKKNTTYGVYTTE